MIKTCTPLELKEKMNQNTDLFLVDCRTQEEFDSGHIPTAHHIPLGSDLSAYEWPEIEPIYVICHSGGRSMAFCMELDDMGFDSVNVEGGMIGWNGTVSLTCG